MKKILMIVFTVLLISNICYAEQWESIGHDNDAEFLIDKDFIKLTHKDYQDLWKAKVKILKENQEYSICFILVDNDIKKWGTYFMEFYNKDNKLTDQREFKIEWNGRTNKIWDSTIDKIIEVGRQKEGK